MSKEISLKDGRIVVLKSEPKGRHAAQAAKISNNNQDLVAAAIAAQVVEINGKGVTMEEILDLPLADYFAVVMLVMGTEGNDLLPASK
jgi:hypothetical protein